MGNYGTRIIVGRENEYDRAGYSVTGIGDFNGDGIDDFAVSTRNGQTYDSGYYGDGGYGRDVGSVFIVYGNDDADLRINLDDIDGTNGFEIQSDSAVSDNYYSTTFGFQVKGLGDVDGDGVADFGIVENATYSSYYGYYRSDTQGVAYIVYGGQTVSDDSVSVADLDHFRIDVEGEIEELTALGDVNGDTFNDIGVTTKSDSPDSRYVGYYTVYDANENLEYDYDPVTNPNESQYSNRGRYAAIKDVTGYVIFGTNQPREDDSAIANEGGSETILNVTEMTSGEGFELDLGQELSGGGFYGEFGNGGGPIALASAARSESIVIGDDFNEGGYSYGSGIISGVDIDGDGFADIVVKTAGVYAENTYVFRAPDGTQTFVNANGDPTDYYSGGVFGFPNEVKIISGDDGSTEREIYLDTGSSDFGIAAGLSGLGNFSGNDAAEELALFATDVAFGVTSQDVNFSNVNGVFVINGAGNFFTETDSNFGIDDVFGGEGSFFYSSQTFVPEGSTDPEQTLNRLQGVLGVGDVTGDGIDDLLIMSRNRDEDGFFSAAYIVAGTTEARTGFFDLVDLVADGDAYQINNISSNSFERFVVSTAGDVDNDGAQDVLVGMSRGDGSAEVLHGGLASLEAMDNADGTDDNVIEYANRIVDVDTGLVPIDVTLDAGSFFFDEGDDSTVDANFRVTRTGDLSATVTVDFEVVAGGSTFYQDADASDFDASGAFPSGTVTFAEGSAEAFVAVPLAGDVILEPNEDFSLVISNATTDNGAGINILEDTAIGVIRESDQPVSLSVSSRSVSEADDGETTTLLMQINRFGNTLVEASVDWSADPYVFGVSSTAEAEDFANGLPQSGSVTFAPGETTKFVELEVVGDSSVEGTERITFTISNATTPSPVGVNITTNSSTGTIFDNDFPVTFVVNNATVTEGDATDVELTFTITRSGVIDADATVDYQLFAGTATADDFTSGFADPVTGLPLGGTLQFASGETTQTVTMQVAGDLIDEGFSERFDIRLSNATTDDANGAVIGDSFGRGTIIDNDASVQFSALNVSVDEGDPGDDVVMAFTIQRSGLTNISGTVDYVIEGFPSSSASADATDFVSTFPTSGTLSFAAGETSKTVELIVSGDLDVESNEFVQLLLSNPTAENGADTRIVSANGTGTIRNDDFPVVFSGNFNAVDEGDEGETTDLVVTVSRFGNTEAPATIGYIVSPSSFLGADDDDIVGTFNLTGTLTFGANVTSQQIVIPIQGDNDLEDNERVEIALVDADAGGVATQVNTPVITAQINNDDLPVFFQSNSVTVTEGQDGALTAMTFLITRTGEIDVDARVEYSIDGSAFSSFSASEAADFLGGLPQTGALDFVAGETSKTIELQVVDDGNFEGNEAIRLTLENATATDYAPGAQVLFNGQGVIIDDEIPVDFRVFGDNILEGDPGETETLSFRVTRTGDLNVEASVDYSVSTYLGAGISDADLDGEPPLPINGTLTFLAGQSELTVDVDVLGDQVIEGTEYLQIDLSNPTSPDASAALRLLNTRAFGTVRDDDEPTYFRVFGSSVNEGDAGASNSLVFTIVRYGDTSAAASVDYDLSGGTVSADDFVAGTFPASGSISFAANETSKTISIPIEGDETVEANEITYFRLSNPTSTDSAIPAQLGTSVASAQIINDDFPAYISVGFQSSVSEGDTASDNRTLTFALNRSGDLSSEVSVDYTFAGDGFNATDAADFEAGTAFTGTVVFAAGSETASISFQVAEDTDIEATERGRLTLDNALVVSGPANASVEVVRDAAFGYIQNDDFPPSIEVLVNGSYWSTRVNEGNSGFTDVTVTFVREGNLDGALTVDYDLTTNQGSIFAADSQDIDGFLPAPGLSVDFADGVGVATAVIRINGDGLIEANESFQVRVTGYDSSENIDYDVTTPVSTITIVNDDGRPPIPELPVDDDGDGIPDRFVRVEADVFGDPHITTLDGLGYDFQAVGEYVLVESEAGATNPFSVQVRFEALPGSDLVSVTTRMAVEVAGSVVEVDALNPDAPLIIDGVATALADVPLAGLDLDGDMVADIYTDDGKVFIQLNEAGETLHIGVMDGFLNVCVFLADPAAGGNAGAVRGLMGNANGDLTDDFELRDGSDIPESAISFDDDGVPALTFDYIYGFGEFEGGGYKGSWQIDETEANFSGETPDFPANFPAAPLKLEDLPADVRAAAEAAAIGAGLSEADNAVIFENAVLDFALTGSDGFLDGATGLAAQPEEASTATEAPDLAPTVNVSSNVTSIVEGDDGTQAVEFTFYRLGDATGTLAVDYEVGGDIDANDLAPDTPLSGTVAFEDGQDSISLTIVVAGDLETEGDEGLQVMITGTDNPAVLVGASTGETTILTDDFGPDAQDDAASGVAGETISGNVLEDNGQGEDTDPDDDSLTVVGVVINGEPLDIGDGPFDLGNGRSLEMDVDGNFSLDNGDFYDDLPEGSIETVSFGYVVSDGNGGTDTAEVTLAIVGNAVPNEAPIATGDDITVDEDVATAIDFLSNDEDPEGDDLTVEILEGPDNGTLMFNGSEWIYTSAQDYNGDDSFTYEISDGEFADTATVNLTVSPVNDAPVLLATGPFDVDENTTAVGTITASDVDIGDAPFSFSIIGGDDAALFNIDETSGALSFADAPDFEMPGDTGEDNQYEVQVQVSDGDLTSDSFVFVNVQDVDEAPVLNPVTGTDGNDRNLVGTDGADLIDSMGGRFDIITGGGGGDVFDFSNTTENGAREVRRINDFDATEGDGILLGDNTEVTTVREVRGSTYLFLNEDRDVIILNGVSGFDTDSFL